MKAGGGGQKGSAFERMVCVHLSLWWSKGARNDLFWRSSMSGGRATVAAKKGTIMAHISGDICSVHADGHAFVDEYYVECKHYKNLDLMSFITKYKGGLAKFWTTAVKQAARYNKQPVLIARQNGYPTIVLTPTMALGSKVALSAVFATIRTPTGLVHLALLSDIFPLSKKPKLRSKK